MSLIKKSCLILGILIISNSLIAQELKWSDVSPNQEAIHQCSHSKQKTLLFQPKSHIGQEYDIQYVQMNYYIDPGLNYIDGWVRNYLEIVAPVTFSLSFELSSSLTVDSVLVDQVNTPFSHLSGNILQVNLATSLQMGMHTNVDIYYGGVPGTSGFGSFVQSDHAGTPIVWTLSEPYGAKDWWPCKNDLSDKIDSLDVIIETPNAYRVASNGLLVNETPNITSTTYHWKHRYPIATYLVAFAVTNYSYYSDFAYFGNDTVEILNYVFPEDLSSAQASTPRTVEVMNLFDSLFVPYPFLKEKYGHAQFGWGGGMEHQTMSFMGGFSHGLIAHELAHMWFGDMITCGSWQDIWLNEGFATYLTGLTYEFMFNGIYWPVWKSQTRNTVISGSDGSVFCDDTTSVGRIFSSRLSYNKGAIVLHMVRWVIGDQAFFEGVKNYLNDPGLMYGYAHTPDLIYHLEQSHGQSLSWFFDDWYTGQGHPIYNIHAEEHPNDEYHVRIDQSQSDPSVSFFEMPVPVRMKGPNGDSIFVFDHTFSGEIFTINTGFEVDSIFFDPEIWLAAEVQGTTVGIEQVNFTENQIRLMPNPVKDLLLIEHVGVQIEQIQIYSLSGKLIKEEWNNISSSSIQIDLSKFATGIYNLQFRTKDGSIVNKKLVKI